MVTIWGQIIINAKIVKSSELVIPQYDYHNFEEYVRELCQQLDLPTPIVLDKHTVDFTVYKNTQFFADDFVESIDFDKLKLECI